jgi:hypothetical protein
MRNICSRGKNLLDVFEKVEPLWFVNGGLSIVTQLAHKTKKTGNIFLDLWQDGQRVRRLKASQNTEGGVNEHM